MTTSIGRTDDTGTSRDPGTSRDSATFRATVPPLLSFVSGFVDTVGFLALLGLLTSQVTGSFVAAGASFVAAEGGLTAKLLAIPTFMVGAVAMTLLVALLARAKMDPMPWALVTVAVLIAAFLWLGRTQGPFRSLDDPAAIGTAIAAFLAMGAESALVRVLFKGSLPANFMTGNVTQVAVEATDMMLARRRMLFDGDPIANAERATAARRQLGVLLPMITGFVLGCASAAHAFVSAGFDALVIAAGVVLFTALWAAVLRIRR
jgi:uncharacterized membrane protein YoaK (UPF0700 family)